jgi:hypothetical protein
LGSLLVDYWTTSRGTIFMDWWPQRGNQRAPRDTCLNRDHKANCFWVWNPSTIMIISTSLIYHQQQLYFNRLLLNKLLMMGENVFNAASSYINCKSWTYNGKSFERFTMMEEIMISYSGIYIFYRNIYLIRLFFDKFY